jgi:hypothetical protein
MPRHPDDIPAVRDSGDSIEIDAKKGKWPFMKAIWGEDKHGRERLIFIIDSNEGGQIVGENANVGILGISRKKAEALHAFLGRTLNQ